jgi:hypothetical protein
LVQLTLDFLFTDPLKRVIRRFGVEQFKNCKTPIVTKRNGYPTPDDLVIVKVDESDYVADTYNDHDGSPISRVGSSGEG